MLTIFYLLTALLLPITAGFKRNKGAMIAGTLYAVFAIIFSGRMFGLIPAVPIAEIISQQGYDTGLLPVSVDSLINSAIGVATLFNLLSLLFILKAWGWGKWLVSVVAAYALIGLIVGPIILRLSPVYCLFGLCCATMAIVGWGLGLTYVEFCVIGNIWVQVISVVASAVYMIYRRYKSPVIWIIGVVEILTMSAIALHYFLPMSEAFYQCVRDLQFIARQLNLTYMEVNLLIYFPGWLALLVFNLLVSRRGNDRGSASESARQECR